MPKPLFTDSEMVSVRAFAPFEIVEVMAEWTKRYKEENDADRKDPDIRWKMSREMGFFYERREQRVGGLGAPYRYYSETPEAFGLRVAAAIFRLIKEV